MFRVRSNRFNERKLKSAEALTTNLRFEVEDTGIGIVPEHLEEIFLPFHQVGEAQYSAEGTGLGLAISRKLVEMMGGELRAKSTFGEGSIFWFEVHLQEIPGFVPKVKLPEQKIIGYKGEQRIVLVVDDKWENRAILTSMLLPLGFKVVEAENGQECVEKALKFKPDLILLDLRMPILDGFGATQQIRQIEAACPEQGRRIVIIAVSASVFEATRKRALAIGFNDFLFKPFLLEKFLNLVQTHLQLEWIYEEDSEKKVDVNVHTQSASEFAVLLPPKERHMLHQLAVRGNVKGILEYLNHIEQLGDQYLPLVTELRTLAKSFQVDTIVELLEDMEKNHEKNTGH